MPKAEDLERLARARVQQTGESHTVARARLLESQDPLPAEYQALAGTSDEVVRTKTGKTWKQWVRALDAVGAREMPHPDIARHVSGEYDVSSWWAQTITVGYERIRGLRDVGQRRGGGYDVNKSKTVPVPVTELYEAFANEDQRGRWLPGVTFEIRASRPLKTLRVVWHDGTAVDVGFTDKGESKSAVSIQHRKIPSKEEASLVRAFWTERLEALADHVTGPV